MIQLQISKKSINKVDQMIVSKVKQAEVVINRQSLDEIAKAVFTITSSRFLKDLSIAAMENPKKFHHIYEWNRVGVNSDKLFLIRRNSIKNGSINISFVPLQSSKPVPIDPNLLEMGPSGKTVTSQSIFKDKMRVMEDGNPIHFITRQTIAFYSNFMVGGVVFVPKGHVIDIMHPGGDQTSGALRKFSSEWYQANTMQAVSESRMIGRIASEVARTLNDSFSSEYKVQDAVKRVATAYSKGVSEI